MHKSVTSSTTIMPTVRLLFLSLALSVSACGGSVSGGTQTRGVSASSGSKPGTPVDLNTSVEPAFRIETTDPVDPIDPVDPVVSAPAPITLTSTTPSANATDVATAAVIRVVFSKAIDPATATAADVVLTGSGGSVAGVVNVSGDTLTFAPSSVLVPASSYTLTLSAGIKSVDGVLFGTTTQIAFTTVAAMPPPSGPAFVAVSATPANNAVSVARSIAPSMQFSQPLSPTSVTSGSVFLAAPLSSTIGNVAGTLATLHDSVSFTPSSVLPWGTRYSFNATTAVTSGSGTALSTPESFGFTTSQATFKTEANVQSAIASQINSLRVQMDSQGNGMAIWTRAVGSNSVVHAARYDFNAVTGTGAWTVPVVIQTGTNDSLSPILEIDDSGNAFAIWVQRGGAASGSYRTTVARYNIATGWAAAQEIQTGTTQSAAPHIDFDKIGNAMAIWEQDDGNGIFNIMTAAYSATTGTWSTASLLSNPGSDAHSPKVGFDEASNAIAVWTQDNGSTVQNMVAARYSAMTSTWLAPVSVYTGPAVLEPALAVDRTGNAMAVWRQQNGGNYNAYAARYSFATNIWEAATSIQTGTANIQEPSVKADPAGNFFAIWRQSGTIVAIYRATIATPGWTISRSFIESNTGSQAIAIDSAGNAMATWAYYSGTGSSNINGMITNYNLYLNAHARYNPATNSWNPRGLYIGPNGTSQSRLGAFAMDRLGNGLYLGVHQSSTTSRIFARSFTGTP